MRISFNPMVKLSLFTALVAIVGCSPLMATFDQASYSQVTSLKVDALALMDKSVEDYSSRTADVAALQLELNKAIEYDKHRPKNQITNEMWTLMSDSTGHLLGGFLVKWKKDGKESAFYLKEKEKQVGEAFDQIAELEIKKIKSN